MTHQFDPPACQPGSNTMKPLCARVYTSVRSTNRIGASARAQSLKGSGKSPASTVKHTKKLKSKHRFACMHARSISLRVTHLQAVCPRSVLCGGGRQCRWPSHHITHPLLSALTQHHSQSHSWNATEGLLVFLFVASNQAVKQQTCRL